MIEFTKGREKGQYWPFVWGSKKSATITCPDCGESAAITKHHISDDGTVHPSVVCPFDPCNFHEYIRLVGWEG